MSKIKVIFLIFTIGIIGFFGLNSSGASAEEIDLNTFEISNVPVKSPEKLISFHPKEAMTASWYGNSFHGKFTANGEVFNQTAYTAAHKELPFGTLLRLTNPKNQKSVIVRITDRGPYVKGRDIDLSNQAAKELGILHKGVVKVKVEEISFNSSVLPISSF